MGVQVFNENWFVMRWPECDTDDVRSLIEKLYKYRNKAGYKNDSLGLTKRDREIIKQMYECFERDEEK